MESLFSMEEGVRHCAHCGGPIVRRANETPRVYSTRVFCGVACLGRAKVARRTDRFWAKVDKRGPSDCWEWRGFLSDRGYGQFATGDKNYRAHRFALLATGVEVPDDAIVLHTCDNPPCCNPAHLKVGTHLDNNRDMIAKGRDKRFHGERHPNAKLTDKQRAEVVKRRGEPQRILANEFSVTRATICRVQKAAICG